MISNVYTVTTTAVKVYETGNATNRIYVRATGSHVFLGGAGVTDVNGLKLDANSVIEITVDELETLYAIVTTGTHNVHVLSPNQS
jgi:hypothetical protein